MKYAQVKGDNVIIKLPIDVLVTAFNYYPENYEEAKVKYKRKFAQAFADLVNEYSADSESGLTVFQEWIDSIFDEMLESRASYLKFPKKDEDDF